jgi:hypothetical protein
MNDGFDDLPAASAQLPAEQLRTRRGVGAILRVPDLVAEVYRNATAPLRGRLLECLLRPVGPLALVAVAAGAFGQFLQRGGYRQVAIAPEDAARISPEQMLELARYVEQASPESLLQIVPLLADHPVGMAGVAASVLLVTLQAWRQRASR